MVFTFFGVAEARKVVINLNGDLKKLRFTVV